MHWVSWRSFYKYQFNEINISSFIKLDTEKSSLITLQ